MPKYRHGAAAIEQAATKKGGGGGRSFAPEIFWKEADEKKYVLVLTPADEIGIFDLHEWIPLKGEKKDGEEYEYFASFMSRKDPYIEEDYDKIEDDLERKPKTRCMGVAVELEPVMETKKGRKRPTSFAVKTKDYERNTEDGEETVTVPLIGLITQSSQLMWSPLNGLDESQGPLEDLPLEVTRRIPGGQKSNTTYEFIPFPEIPVDLSPVVEYLDGISYFNEEDLTDLITELEATDGDDLQSAQVVARALMEKRVEELADGDRYEDLLGDVDYLEPPAWEKGKKGKKKVTTSREDKPKRPARPKRRKAVQSDEEAEEPETTEREQAETEPSKDDKFAKLKARLDK